MVTTKAPVSWRLTDCPRDAMQGLPEFIPTERKVAYLSALMEVGFDVLDAGSFVSPKAVPQMADTADVLSALPQTATEVLAIVANLRGAEDALSHGRPDILGFPFSISETFQQRNTGGGIEDGWRRLDAIRNAAERKGKAVVAYLSMGFGNPYGDPWHAAMVGEWCGRLHAELDIRTIALSDTVGQATPDVVDSVFGTVVDAFPEVTLGAHLHGRPEQARLLMEARLFWPSMKVSPADWGAEEREWNRDALERAQRIRKELFD